MKTLRAHALARWVSLSPREQRGVSVIGALMGLLLFWTLAFAPALNTLRDSEARRHHIEQQRAHMLALQQLAQALQTRSPLSRDEALRNLQGLSQGAPMQLTAQGDRVSVQLKAVPASTLTRWLAQARNQAHALPLEAHLTRVNAASPAVVWDGSLVLLLPTRHAAKP